MLMISSVAYVFYIRRETSSGTSTSGADGSGSNSGSTRDTSDENWCEVLESLVGSPIFIFDSQLCLRRCSRSAGTILKEPHAKSHIVDIFPQDASRSIIERIAHLKDDGCVEWSGSWNGKVISFVAANLVSRGFVLAVVPPCGGAVGEG